MNKWRLEHLRILFRRSTARIKYQARNVSDRVYHPSRWLCVQHNVGFQWRWWGWGWGWDGGGALTCFVCLTLELFEWFENRESHICVLHMASSVSESCETIRGNQNNIRYSLLIKTGCGAGGGREETGQDQKWVDQRGRACGKVWR